MPLCARGGLSLGTRVLSLLTCAVVPVASASAQAAANQTGGALSAGEIVGIAVAAVLTLAGGLYGLRGEFSPTRVTRDGRLYIRRREYHLRASTGVVLQAKKTQEARVWGGGERQGIISLGSRTYVHDALTFLTKEGPQEPTTLTNFDVNVSHGATVTTVRAVRTGKRWGSYIIAYNHDTNQPFYGDDAIHALYLPHGLWYLLGVVLGAVLGAVAPSADVGFSVGAVVFVVAAVVTAIVRERVARRRARMFKRRQDLKEYLAGIADEIRQNPLDLPGGGYAGPALKSGS